VAENSIINSIPIKEELKAQTNLSFSMGKESFASVLEQEDNKTLKETEKELEEDLSILSTDEENQAIAKSRTQKNIKTKQITGNIRLISPVTPMEELQAETNKILQVKSRKTKEEDTEVYKSTSNAEFLLYNVDKNNIMLPDAEFVMALSSNDCLNLSDILSGNNLENKQNQLSAKLIEILKKSMEENKPIRLDFDNKISVIIKITKEGKISAEFISESEEAENYLRSNISALKTKFEEQNIKYDKLSIKTEKINRKDKEQSDE